MNPVSKIVAAILFSGGDAPGMNALLRAFVRLGLNRYQAQVLGVKDGFLGLVSTCERLDSGELYDGLLRKEMGRYVGLAGMRERRVGIVRMDHCSVSRLVDQGGIVLGSSRCEGFKKPEVRLQVLELLKGLGVSALVVGGGDGSLAGAAALAHESDLCVIGIPATIDNDYPPSERTLGSDTAGNCVVNLVRLVNDTAGSMHRVMVLETMGRASGHLAREAAVASGAEIVVTPERGPVDDAKMHAIAERIENDMLRGRSHAVVLVAEGVALALPSAAGATKALADYLQTYFHREGSHFPHVDIRYSVLGHLQRGGSPTVADRRLAADSAEAAWEAIVAPRPKSGVIALVGGRVRRLDFDAKPPADRDREIQRIYQLQKDLSDYGQPQVVRRDAQSTGTPNRRVSARRQRKDEGC